MDRQADEGTPTTALTDAVLRCMCVCAVVRPRSNSEAVMGEMGFITPLAICVP
jgi:hypothetical protein